MTKIVIFYRDNMSDHISSECARSLYKKAGTLTREDPVSLTIPRNEHLLSDKVDLIIT